MKSKNGNNKVERQINYLKNYLSIKIKVKSNHYFVVDNKKEVDDVFVTNTQPVLTNSRYGSCYRFDFDNGTLFAPCWAVCFCRDEAGTILIKTKNEKGKTQAVGCDDYCLLKDTEYDVLIRINSEHCGRDKAQTALEKCYQINENENDLLKKLERIN